MLCHQAPYSLLAVVGEVMGGDARCGRPVENGSHGGASVGARVASVTCTFCTSTCMCAMAALATLKYVR